MFCAAHSDRMEVNDFMAEEEFDQLSDTNNLKADREPNQLDLHDKEFAPEDLKKLEMDDDLTHNGHQDCATFVAFVSEESKEMDVQELNPDEIATAINSLARSTKDCETFDHSCVGGNSAPSMDHLESHELTEIHDQEQKEGEMQVQRDFKCEDQQLTLTDPKDMEYDQICELLKEIEASQVMAASLSCAPMVQKEIEELKEEPLMLCCAPTEEKKYNTDILLERTVESPDQEEEEKELQKLELESHNEQHETHEKESHSNESKAQFDEVDEPVKQFTHSDPMFGKIVESEAPIVELQITNIKTKDIVHTDPMILERPAPMEKLFEFQEESRAPMRSVAPMQKLLKIQKSQAPIEELIEIQESQASTEELLEIQEKSQAPIEELLEIKGSQASTEELSEIQESQAQQMEELSEIQEKSQLSEIQEKSQALFEELLEMKKSQSQAPTEELLEIQESRAPIEELSEIQESQAPIEELLEIQESQAPMEELFETQETPEPLEEFFEIQVNRTPDKITRSCAPAVELLEFHKIEPAVIYKDIVPLAAVKEYQPVEMLQQTAEITSPMVELENQNINHDDIVDNVQDVLVATEHMQPLADLSIEEAVLTHELVPEPQSDVHVQGHNEDSKIAATELVKEVVDEENKSEHTIEKLVATECKALEIVEALPIVQHVERKCRPVERCASFLPDSAYFEVQKQVASIEPMVPLEFDQISEAMEGSKNDLVKENDTSITGSKIGDTFKGDYEPFGHSVKGEEMKVNVFDFHKDIEKENINCAADAVDPHNPNQKPVNDKDKTENGSDPFGSVEDHSHSCTALLTPEKLDTLVNPAHPPKRLEYQELKIKNSEFPHEEGMGQVSEVIEEVKSQRMVDKNHTSTNNSTRKVYEGPLRELCQAPEIQKIKESHAVVNEDNQDETSSAPSKRKSPSSLKYSTGNKEESRSSEVQSGKEFTAPKPNYNVCINDLVSSMTPKDIFADLAAQQFKVTELSTHKQELDLSKIKSSASKPKSSSASSLKGNAVPGIRPDTNTKPGTMQQKQFDVSSIPLEDVMSEMKVRIARLKLKETFTDKDVGDDLTYLKELTRYGKHGSAERLKLLESMTELGILEIYKKVFNLYATVRLTGSLRDVTVILWNGTDKCKAMCEAIINSNIHVEVMDKMKEEYFSPDNIIKNVSRKYLLKGMMGIMNNTSRLVDSARTLWREIGGIETMMKYRDSKDTMVKCKTEIILSFLMTEKEYEETKADDSSIKFILKLLADAIESPEHQSKKYGFSVDEVMEALNRMAVSDHNKEKIVAHGGLEHYITLTADTCTRDENHLAAQGLWILAFRCKEQLLAHDGCVTALRELLARTEDGGVRKQAEGALWILDGRDHDTTREADASTESAYDVPHVFISYQWSCQEMILRIRDKLKQHGYKVWMDVDSMSGSILEAMGRAVEQAAVVIIAMSSKYVESPNCRTEAEYTFRRQKDIVPLRMQHRYQPEGWLGALVGNKLFFDFSTENRFERSMAGLIRELGQRGKVKVDRSVSQNGGDVIVPQSVTSVTRAAPPSAPSGAATWGTQQVTDWLSKVKVTSTVQWFADVDGAVLTELQELHRDAPEFYYKVLQEEVGLDLKAILRFTRALKALR